MSDFRELKARALERHLKKHLRGEVRFDPAARHLYSTDASIYQIEPLGVVLPQTVEDLRAAVQIAGEHQTPIVPRGGGTSLSGQCIGAGLVLDVSKYLNQIVAIDPAARTARVQPGVVLDQFNRALEPYGLQFGPDVSTASRANLGGLIGNNSAGARSIVYGKTIDHVRQLQVVLADGSQTVLGPLTAGDWFQRSTGKGLEAAVYRTVRQVTLQHQAAIRQRFPAILRRVSGYNLDAMLDQFVAAENGWRPPAGPLNLAPLVVGSEGTLALITEAEVKVVPRPAVRGLLVPHFDSLSSAMNAVAACLEMGPSAVELLDRQILELAQANLGLKRHTAHLVGRPAALLMVEFSGDDPCEVEDKVARLEQRLGGVAGVTALVRALDPAVRDPLWDLRRAGMPLILGQLGPRKPVTFIEDTAVPPARLPEFVARFRELFHRHGTDGAFYGHASVGCLHVRPVLNLKTAEDVARMRRMMEEATDLVLEFGGALSGEHGDGLARSEWNRKMFGAEVYNAFRQVKHAFDPANLLNPGKVVDAPSMTANLRLGPDYRAEAPPTVFDYRRQEGFAGAAEACNGNGACRKLQGGTMCPSYRATRDEKDSTRGRANGLRRALSGHEPLKDLRSKWLFDVFDLCLMCKGCKAECPSNVDVGKLKAEFLHLYYSKNRRPLGHFLLGHVYRLQALASWAAPVVNWLGRNRVMRWVLEQVAGIDRRRSLPLFERADFRAWFRRRRGGPGVVRRPVLLLDDCFTTYNEPAIGRAAVTVLERAGCGVELAGLVCCGRPLISKGFLTEARQLVAHQAPKLAARLTSGQPILGLEPSCLLTLADEWPDLLPSEDTQAVARAALLAEDWLAREAKEGRLALPLKPRPERCLLHGHCHQKALVGAGGSAAALRLVPELRVEVIDSGCCGMAGSFGYEKGHFDVSAAVANLALLPGLQRVPEALVAAPGTSCRHQIKDLAGRRAQHPLEILAEQLLPPLLPESQARRALANSGG